MTFTNQGRADGGVGSEGDADAPASQPQTGPPTKGSKKLPLLVSGIALATLMLVGVGTARLFGQSSPPKITWSQANVLEFVQPNQTRTITVSFRSNQSTKNVAVFVTPALSPVLSVSPATFSTISANQPFQLTLTLKAGTQSEIKFDGTIQIKSNGSGNSSTYAQPLPTTIVVHDQYVPPDPGIANNSTIAGIDSDNDGIRDDIQRLIVVMYFTSPAAVADLSTYVRALQSLILTGDEDDALQIALTRRKAAACWDYLFPTDERRTLDKFQDTFVNTPERLRAYLDADRLLGGHVYSTIQVNAAACK
jgi:hypothetical protein